MGPHLPPAWTPSGAPAPAQSSINQWLCHSLAFFFAPVLRFFSRPEGYEAFILQGAGHTDARECGFLGTRHGP